MSNITRIGKRVEGKKVVHNDPIIIFPSEVKSVYELNSICSKKIKIDIDSEVDGELVGQSFMLFLKYSRGVVWTKFSEIGDKIPYEIKLYSIGRMVLSIRNLWVYPVMVTTRTLV